MFHCLDWLFYFPLGAVLLAVSAFPVLVIAGLCVYACVVALSADKCRSRRGQLVLRDLLTVLRELCRRGRR